MCKPVENILKHNGIKADNKLEYNIFLWVFWPIPILWLKQHAGSLRLPHFTWCVTRGSSSVRLELNSPRIFLRSVPLRETRKQEYLPAWAIVEFVIPSYTSRYKHEGCIFLGEQLSREGSASAPSAAPPVSQHALYFFVDVNILKFHKQGTGTVRTLEGQTFKLPVPSRSSQTWAAATTGSPPGGLHLPAHITNSSTFTPVDAPNSPSESFCPWYTSLLTIQRRFLWKLVLIHPWRRHDSTLSPILTQYKDVQSHPN